MLLLISPPSASAARATGSGGPEGVQIEVVEHLRLRVPVLFGIGDAHQHLALDGAQHGISFRHLPDEDRIRPAAGRALGGHRATSLASVGLGLDNLAQEALFGGARQLEAARASG